MPDVGSTMPDDGSTFPDYNDDSDDMTLDQIKRKRFRVTGKTCPLANLAWRPDPVTLSTDPDLREYAVPMTPLRRVRASDLSRTVSPVGSYSSCFRHADTQDDGFDADAMIFEDWEETDDDADDKDEFDSDGDSDQQANTR
jgi:hypothetical protein